MKTKIALKYGLISGGLIVGSWFLTIGMSENPDFAIGEVIGYAIMLAALTAVFLGIKRIRDEQGSLSFKEAFLNGLGITLVASIVYVAGWMIYMPNFAPEFVDKYRLSQIELIEQSDATQDEKTKEINEMNEWMDSYKKPHVMAAMTFTEIFPVGLIVTLISSLILKRK